MALVIASDAFEDGGIVPPRYSCFGTNVQPGFTFSDPPDGTACYALLLHDIDVALDGRTEDGLHWAVWNIPVEAAGIPEGSVPKGAVVGKNVEDRNEYLGPGAPPGARYHHPTAQTVGGEHIMTRSTLDPDNLPLDPSQNIPAGHDARALGRSDSSDTGSELIGDGSPDDDTSDREGTGERASVDPEIDARTDTDIGFDRIVDATQAGLGGGLDQAEEAQLGITDEEIAAALGDEDDE